MTISIQLADVFLGGVAVLVMVVAGLNQRALRWRTVRCPVCHRSRQTCTCRFL